MRILIVADRLDCRGRHWLNMAGYKHRTDDYPAIIEPGGDRGWFQHDRLHRDGGKAAYLGVTIPSTIWAENGEFTKLLPNTLVLRGRPLI